MTLLSPWALWFLAGIPIICLLYLLKVRREKRSVSALFLWERVLLESQRKALFARLRNPLSLLLQLLIFLLLIAALAKPSLHPESVADQATVLVLDTRARMQALEPDGRTRLVHAIEQARALVSNASAQSPVAILQAGAQTRVLSGFSTHPPPLHEALNRVHPSDAGGTLTEALALASHLSGSCTKPAKILLFSDNLPPAPIPPNLQLIPSASPRDNLAITRLASRQLPNSPETCEILLEVANFSAQPAKPNIELRLDQKLLDVKPFQIQPGQRVREFFRIPIPQNRSAKGRLVATLSPPDALPLDNQAFAVIPPRPKLRILLVSDGNWFLEKLLEADRKCSYELLSPAEFKTELAAAFDAVILDTPATLSTPSPDSLPKNTLILHGSPWEQGQELVSPLFPEPDPAHPIMRLVDFSTVSILKAKALPVPPSASPWIFQSPLRHLDQPLVLTAEHPVTARRIVVLGFELTQSNLPLRIAFPIFFSNILQWLSAVPDQIPQQITAGDSLTLPQNHTLIPPINHPQSASEVSPAAPLINSFPSDTPPKTSPVFQPMIAGFHEIRSGNRINQLAVNLFSDSESDLRTAAPAGSTPNLAARLSAATASTPSQWLLLCALLLSLVEWHLFHRRRIE